MEPRSPSQYREAHAQIRTAVRDSLVQVAQLLAQEKEDARDLSTDPANEHEVRQIRKRISAYGVAISRLGDINHAIDSVERVAENDERCVNA